jgi:hypothetical protein
MTWRRLRQQPPQYPPAAFAQLLCEVFAPGLVIPAYPHLAAELAFCFAWEEQVIHPP